MGAEEAVFTAATAREEVRKSLVRMEYHLARGKKGLRGVEREQAFLNAMGRQSARLGAKTAAGVNVGAKTGLGTRARAALTAKANGNGASAGRLRSSLLAEYSQDTMNGAREWTYAGDETWTWIANASACPACLDMHGKLQQGPFVPMHPSCLCYPEHPDEAAKQGVRPLTQEEISGTLTGSNNPVFAKVGQAIADGRTTVGDAAVDATRRSARGLTRWAKTLEEQSKRAADLGGEGGIAGGAPSPTPEPQSPAPAAAEATIVDEVPTVAEVKAAEPVQIEHVTLRQEQAAIKYSAKKHAKVLDESEVLLNQVIDNPAYATKLNEVLGNLDEFSTYSQGSNATVGQFSWRESFGGERRARAIRVNMRRLDESRIPAFNAQMEEVNVAIRDLNARIGRREIDRITYDAEYKRLKARLPKKGQLMVDTKPTDIVDTLVHEGFHAIDEANDFALGQSVRGEVQDEVRAIYRSTTDPNAKAFSYASELHNPPPPTLRGVETAAEMVRMYFMGTGEAAVSHGLTPITAAEWRATYPKLAAWVEKALEAAQ